jgi:hypothetical protein
MSIHHPVVVIQNRQSAFQQAKADHDFVAQEQKLKVNTDLRRQIHELTRDMHERMVGVPAGGAASPPTEDPGRSPMGMS